MSILSWRLEDGVGVVTLNRPPANAIATEVIEGLSELFDEIESKREVKVVLLHGEGRFFSAGADIKEFTEMEPGEDHAKLSRKGQQVFDKIEGFKKPVIAAIHGAALGGGLELAMACHMRVATDNAKLGLPEMQLGLIPGFAGTQRLPRLIGTPKATEMLMLSEPISGELAYEWGLVNRFVPEDKLMEESMKLAKKIAKKSAISLKYGLECLAYAQNGFYEDGAKYEADKFGEIFKSHDAQEGIQAFIEKRNPNFKDR